MKYDAKLVNEGGRQGLTRTKDGKHEFNVVIPKNEIQPENTYNPELLFAAAVVSCYNGAFLYHLEQAGKNTDGIEMHIDVELVEDERDHENMLSMKLKPIAPHLDKETIREFAAKAEKTCPYVKIFRGEAKYEIDVD